MNKRSLVLSVDERRELERVRDLDARPYLRERAAALLKIADGMAASVVARQGLLKARHKDTVFAWLNEYEQTRQLRPRPATRGAFSPAGHSARVAALSTAPESAPVGGSAQPLDAVPDELAPGRGARIK